MTMTRREFSRNAAAAVAGITLSTQSDIAGALQSGDSTKKKNILMIVMDQERSWETFPEGLDLPNRQKFAKSGVKFNQYHIASLSCAPSRSVIYTGQHVQTTKLFNNPGHGDPGGDLDIEAAPTLGQMFKKLGYQTAYKGKWHLSPVNALGLKDNTKSLQKFGFDEWHKGPDSGSLVYEGALSDKDILQTARDYLKGKQNTSGEAPWFLSVNFHNPHDVMWLDANGEQAKTRLRPGLVSYMKPAFDQYPYNHDFGFDVPKNFKDDLNTKPEAQRLFLEQAQHFYGKQDFTDEETCRRVINYYAACLLDSDKTIGDMLASLEEFGFLKDTIVILTSDHGEMGGSHGLRHKGPFMYRENINVPLAIRHPDGLSDKMTDTLFSSLDIAPTLLGLVGEKYKKHYPDLKGYDHSRVIIGKKTKGKREAILVNFSNTTQGNPRLDKIRMLAKEAEKKGATPKAFNFPEDFIQFDSRTLGRGIFDGQYKFSRWFCPGDHHEASGWQTLVARNDLELYDVKSDPHELNNLAHHPEKNRELILEINAKLNNLIKKEVGEDLGGHMPGDPKLWSSEI